MSKELICILGPTASGKTSAAIDIARHFNTEILSCDSRQVYREMSIGTAVPNLEELSAVPHHAIQHISIHDEYSVGQYEKESLTLLDDLYQKYDKMVLVGGSGLFAKALIEGLDSFPNISLETREQVNELLKANGLQALLEVLKKKDIACYERIDKQNTARVRRATEVILQTNKPYSSFLNQPKTPRIFRAKQYAIDWNRDELYERINHRVDMMIENGLINEVRNLIEYKNLNSLNTVGYVEIFKYLLKEISLEKAIELIKQNSRRYAKRQLTWLRKQEDITWLKPNLFSSEVIRLVESQD